MEEHTYACVMQQASKLSCQPVLSQLGLRATQLLDQLVWWGHIAVWLLQLGIAAFAVCQVSGVLAAALP
jgi:hypothetical protein